MSEFDPYEILDLNPSVSAAEIKRAYREKSLEYHPDSGRNANAELFAQCTKAKELLLDDKRRELYDMGGWDLINRFDERERMKEFMKIPKCPPFNVRVPVTLAQVYNAESVKVSAKIPTQDGEKDFDLDFPLHGGIVGKKVLVPDQGREASDHKPGDIVIQFDVTDMVDYDFKVQGGQLIVEYPLTLGECLGTFNVPVRHPDGNNYVITGKYAPDGSDSMDMIMVYVGMGLPQEKDPRLPVQNTERGDLIINLSPDLKGFLTLPEHKTEAILRELTKVGVGQRQLPLDKNQYTDITTRGISLEERQRQIRAQRRHVMPMGMLEQLIGGGMPGGMPGEAAPECHMQ